MNNIKPSDWIVNQLELIISNNKINNILDLACGFGRHSIYLNKIVQNIVSIDKNQEKLSGLSKYENITAICFDLEKDDLWPINCKFDIILVVNYLYRKNFYKILDLVKLNGFVIYDTFAQGNERYGRPKNPEFLLKKNELKLLFGRKFDIVKYFHGFVNNNSISVKQRCVAKRVAS